VRGDRHEVGLRQRDLPRGLHGVDEERDPEAAAGLPHDRDRLHDSGLVVRELERCESDVASEPGGEALRVHPAAPLAGHLLHDQPAPLRGETGSLEDGGVLDRRDDDPAARSLRPLRYALDRGGERLRSPTREDDLLRGDAKERSDLGSRLLDPRARGAALGVEGRRVPALLERGEHRGARLGPQRARSVVVEIDARHGVLQYRFMFGAPSVR
jgi:hypothetical protein